MDEEQQEATQAFHHLLLHMQVEVQRRLLGIAVDRLGGTLVIEADELEGFDTGRLDVQVDRSTNTATVITLPSLEAVFGGFEVEIDETLGGAA
jgi:hypothetical protein